MEKEIRSRERERESCERATGNGNKHLFKLFELTNRKTI